MSAFSGVRQLLLSIFHKIVSATCGKNIRILDTETDIRITRISVAALIVTLSLVMLQQSLLRPEVEISLPTIPRSANQI